MSEQAAAGHGEVRARVTVGVGRRFLPLPRAQLVRGVGDGRVAVIPAAAGTPVHAVSAGSVVDVDGQGGLALAGEDGAGQHYAGLDPGRVTVTIDGRVRAGAILGAVGAEGRIEVRLSDQAGRPLDAVEALIGLPDPNELGFQAVGEGLGVDPDALDRELVPADPFAEGAS
jgi:murein DD-endopeptidase MepM/ murein hydrolase activator NlpD